MLPFSLLSLPITTDTGLILLWVFGAPIFAFCDKIGVFTLLAAAVFLCVCSFSPETYPWWSGVFNALPWYGRPVFAYCCFLIPHFLLGVLVYMITQRRKKT